MPRWFTRAPAPPPLPATTQQIRLTTRPESTITSKTFTPHNAPLPSIPPPDHAIVRILYVSADPAMRGWLSTKRSYIAPVALGAPMRAHAIGEVVRAAGSFVVGDVVQGALGWVEHAVVDTRKLERVSLPRGLSPSAALGVLGTTGLTAYFGLIEIGRPVRGDVVVVSAAAGATGSVAVQIASRVLGCFVVGIAGGAEKCRYVREELGVVAVDYKADIGVNEGLKRALDGRGIDVYFDNVGGPTLDAALRRMNVGARVVLCGAISVYNERELPAGPRNYTALISQRASMRGFILYDHVSHFPTARRELARWVREGKVMAREHVVHGLEKAPQALQALFDGVNIGKVVVKVAEPIVAETGTLRAKM